VSDVSDHRGDAVTIGRAVGFDFPGDVVTVLSVQHCLRCGAWRASVAVADIATFRAGKACPLYTEWSAPCSAPSPAKARDDDAS
jgi:hypothetical protein